MRWECQGWNGRYLEKIAGTKTQNTQGKRVGLGRVEKSVAKKFVSEKNMGEEPVGVFG